MLKKILIGLAALLIGLVAAIYVQPSTFSVQRSAIMAAPPARVFAQVNDLAIWESWSPWKGLDPNAKQTISSPSAGKGATLAWTGNEAVGEGSLTIVDSKPDERVTLEQVFIKPLAGKARLAFTFAPEGGGTKVTWKMEGTNGFIGKAMCMVMDMDASLGKDFERGLANIKSVVEAGGAGPGE
jgi:polyketide cyclase/dehydrase/lipid transport protein